MTFFFLSSLALYEVMLSSHPQDKVTDMQQHYNSVGMLKKENKISKFL